MAACADCGLDYATAWPGDAVVSNEVWRQIGAIPGVLCSNCMTRRIVASVPKAVAVWIVPMISDDPLIDLNHLVTVCGVAPATDSGDSGEAGGSGGEGE